VSERGDGGWGEMEREREEMREGESCRGERKYTWREPFPI
jgi:hypothetical protein